MAKAFKELKLIKARFIEEIDELIAKYKENKASVDETNFDEELGQILMDVIDDIKERDWERSF
jgi:NTP pyrophosphatase (non-canonical NTP hydrolase)